MHFRCRGTLKGYLCSAVQSRDTQKPARGVVAVLRNEHAVEEQTWPAGWNSCTDHWS